MIKTQFAKDLEALFTCPFLGSAWVTTHLCFCKPGAGPKDPHQGLQSRSTSALQRCSTFTEFLSQHTDTQVYFVQLHCEKKGCKTQLCHKCSPLTSSVKSQDSRGVDTFQLVILTVAPCPSLQCWKQPRKSLSGLLLRSCVLAAPVLSSCCILLLCGAGCSCVHQEQGRGWEWASEGRSSAPSFGTDSC